MINTRFLSGLLFIVGAALVLLGMEGDATIPIAAALFVVGIALAAGSRRRAHKEG